MSQLEAFRNFAAGHTPKPEEPLPLSSDAGWDATNLGGWQASAYGTTLLGVLVGPSIMFLFQQGDGAIVEIHGTQASFAVPPPSEAIANATPSMCHDDAVHEIVATTLPVAGSDPLTALLLTTDGIPNSYETTRGFFDFCTDIVAFGLEEPDLEERLREWLPQISAKGSNDDVSIALLLSGPAVQRPEQAVQAETATAGRGMAKLRRLVPGFVRWKPIGVLESQTPTGPGDFHRKATDGEPITPDAEETC